MSPRAAMGAVLTSAASRSFMSEPRLEVSDDLVAGQAELLEDLAARGVVEEALRDAVGVDGHVYGRLAQREGHGRADPAADEVVLDDGDRLRPAGEGDDVVADGQHPPRVDDADGASVGGDLLAGLDGEPGEGTDANDEQVDVVTGVLEEHVDVADRADRGQRVGDVALG